MSTTFRRVVPQGAPPVYFVEDEEVDFDKVIKEEKIVLPKVVSWHAHWLAVEGVQPMVPENPPRPPVIGEWCLEPSLRPQWDGCEQWALKGLYPNFGSQSWTRQLRRIKYQEVLSRWHKMLLCTCQPAVAVVAEAARTPIGTSFATETRR